MAGAMKRELDELDGPHSVDDLEICSMCWFVITDEESDQSNLGKGSNLLVGTAGQITDNLKRLKEAGLTMPSDLATVRRRSGVEDDGRPQAV